jgi:hypothetical protein
MGFRIFLCVHSKIVVGIDDGGEFGGRVNAHTTPHQRSAWDSCNIELSDEAEVVSASTQSPVKIGVARLADCNNDAGCCDKLVRLNVVACQSVFAGEV